MTVIGFQTRQELIDWLNASSDPALGELSSAAPVSDWDQEEAAAVVRRLPDSLPKYDVGHPERIAELELLTGSYRGLTPIMASAFRI